MALAGTDLFLVARGTTNYNVTGSALAAFVVANGLPSQAGNAGLFLTTDGTTLSWAAAGGAGGVTSWSGGITGLTPAAATTGAVTLGGTLGIANGGTGATTQQAAIDALLPSQGGNAGLFLATDGTTLSWAAAGGGGGGVTSWSGGTTGLTPAAATTGVVTLGGTLGIANGGTGATTQQAAIDALLPSQGGNAGKYLTTDGTNTAWSASALPATIVSSVTGTAPISVATGTTTPVVSIATATTGATGAIQLATAAEAATGTDAAKAITPATGVPKTPANMTGALYLPGGNDGARPAPSTGMLRYNNQGGTPVAVEYYDGSAWTELATGGGSGTVFAWGRVSSAGVISASGNVASVTAGGGGIYTITFTNPAPNGDYAITGVNRSGYLVWLNPTLSTSVVLQTVSGGMATNGDFSFVLVTS